MLIELYRTLKTYDPEAVTAKTTLRNMGYEVWGLERAERFLIEADVDATFLSDTKDVLINPNKHYHFARSNGKVDGDEKKFRKGDVTIYVETEGDPEASTALNVLRHRYQYGNKVLSVKREVAWMLTFSNLGKEEALGLAEQLAGKPTYFFANPNFQSYRIEV